MERRGRDAGNQLVSLQGVFLALLISAFCTRALAQVSVTISPSLASVATMATQTFTATVSGTSNTAVTWQVSGVTGGNSTLGLISTTIPGTTGLGLYLGPASVPSPATVSVTAVSQADPSKSASATVTISVPSPGPAYYVSTTGSDSNPGTLSAPWRTIQHAANSVTPGSIVYVEGGTYHEQVNLNVPGSASAGYITFTNYPGQNPIVDGTGLTPPAGQTGLFNIQSQSYLIISGLELRNYTTSTRNAVTAGFNMMGAGSYIQVLNNHIHNIVTTGSGCSSSNAFGMSFYGTQAPGSINNVTVSGNEIDHNTTGCSETVTLDGNVQYFYVIGNLVHDNNNIGISILGNEGVAPQSSYDHARDGVVGQNTVYNITSANNPVYHGSLGADGIYVDGGTRTIVERNLVHDSDYGTELAEEKPLPNVTSYVIYRNNLIYNSKLAGISIGGYDSKRGGTDHCQMVNNTLYNNDTTHDGEGEFQIQYYATNNVFQDNILYATQSVLVNDYTTSEPSPAAMDYNLYYDSLGAASATWVWQKTTYTGFSSYQAGTGNDPHSLFADPQFINPPTNLQVTSTSPALDKGTNLGGTVIGIFDYAGNPRLAADGLLDLGAYQQ